MAISFSLQLNLLTDFVGSKTDRQTHMRQEVNKIMWGKYKA